MSNDKCFKCLFYLGDLKCMAFDLIPYDILLAEVEHDKVFDNQNGDFVFMDKEENSIEDFLLKK